MSDFAGRIEALVVDTWFRDPPPIVHAMSASPTRGVAQAFVLQWTKFSRLFPRWVGAVMSNCPEFPVIAYEVENLMSEVVRDPASDTNHYELLVRLGEAVGLSRSEIEAHPILAEGKEAFAYWSDRARNADWLTGFSAVNGLEILGDRNLPARHGVAQGTGLDSHPWADALGLSERDLEFFRVSDEADAGHGSETVQIIVRYTAPDREEGILGTLSESMAHLRRFMDGMWSLASRRDRGGDS